MSAYIDSIRRAPKTLTENEHRLLLKTTGQHRAGLGAALFQRLKSWPPCTAVAAKPFLLSMKPPVVFEVTAFVESANLEHSFSSVVPDFPKSAGNFHAVLDQVATCAFHGTGGNGQSSAEISVVLHMLLIVEKVSAGSIDRLAFVVREFLLGPSTLAKIDPGLLTKMSPG